jgi:putative aldouronate transport system permease protein
VFLGVWRSIGWNTIIYLAAITGVNPELYEAADMDGASRLRKMWHVTLPGIRPVIIILFILALGGMMGADFERFMALSNDLVENVSTVLPVYVWQWGIRQPHVGQAMATAVGLLQNIINFGLLMGANVIVKKLGGSGLW